MNLGAYYQRYAYEGWRRGEQFLRDVRSELRKVTFPSRQETIASTVVVIAAVTVMGPLTGKVFSTIPARL